METGSILTRRRVNKAQEARAYPNFLGDAVTQVYPKIILLTNINKQRRRDYYLIITGATSLLIMTDLLIFKKIFINFIKIVLNFFKTINSIIYTKFPLIVLKYFLHFSKSYSNFNQFLKFFS